MKYCSIDWSPWCSSVSPLAIIRDFEQRLELAPLSGVEMRAARDSGAAAARTILASGWTGARASWRRWTSAASGTV